jgi:hypothetical protein
MTDRAFNLFDRPAKFALREKTSQDSGSRRGIDFGLIEPPQCRPKFLERFARHVADVITIRSGQRLAHAPTLARLFRTPPRALPRRNHRYVQSSRMIGSLESIWRIPRLRTRVVISSDAPASAFSRLGGASAVRLVRLLQGRLTEFLDRHGHLLGLAGPDHFAAPYVRVCMRSSCARTLNGMSIISSGRIQASASTLKSSTEGLADDGEYFRRESARERIHVRYRALAPSPRTSPAAGIG